MNILARIGDRAFGVLSAVCATASVVWYCVILGLRPSSWNRTIREQLGRQILFTGIEALGVVLTIAFLAGILVVVHSQQILAEYGQTALLGTVLVTMIIREIGPLLVSVIVIGRSGTAISAELANMRVRNEVELLDLQGIEPMTYLVLPRVYSLVVSMLCLTVAFDIASLAGGYVLAFLLDPAIGPPAAFAGIVFDSIERADLLNLGAKTVLPGLTTGTICCMEGLGVRGAATEVPQATTRAVVRSILSVLLISAVVSVFTYV